MLLYGSLPGGKVVICVVVVGNEWLCEGNSSIVDIRVM